MHVKISDRQMPLIDDYLPVYQFSETHGCIIGADARTILDAVLMFRPDADPFFKIVIGLREWPMRLFRRSKKLPKPFGLNNFTQLERTDHEIVYGLIGRFWRLDFGLHRITDAHAFKAFDQAGLAKLALGFAIRPCSEGRNQLVTQTRVFCPDQRTRLAFTPYWWLIRPVSGLIRRRILSSIKSASERSVGVR